MMTDKTKLLFQVSAEDFKKIPGSPIAYWTSENLIKDFLLGVPLKKDGDTRQGMATSDNNRFLRFWHEVNFNRIGFDSENAEEACSMRKKWYPYNKGGDFRKWYGNTTIVINYENDGQEVKSLATQLYKTPSRTIKSISEYFKPCISWSKVSSGNIAFRYYPRGFIFDVAGCCIFYKKEEYLYYDFGFVNSLVARAVLNVISPTLNYEAGHIASLPMIRNKLKYESIATIVKQDYLLAKNDWDSYETSWDFQENPLIDAGRHNDKCKMLSDLYGQVRASWEQRCETMRKLEVENNRIFIEIYELQDELSPDVLWDEITLTCNPWYRYGKSPELESDGQHFSTTGEQKVGTIFGMQPTGIKVSEPNPEMKVTSFPFNQELEDRLQKDTVKELISYAVGCMFGRYSLDVPGLAFAGGEWESTNYMTFLPDADNVIPTLDEDWFADDIVGRFQEFLKVAFGEENYHENLAFVEAALGKDIRSYFTKDFYADHVKMYQKRPIYWLFSSPTGAFSALVYLHRYRQDTVGTVLTYLRSHITKVNAHIQEQEEIIASAKASASMKSRAVRERLKMQHELQELEDYERDVLYPLSTERLEIDLDDGVKVNYPKFGKALRPVKGLDAKEE